MNKDKLVKSGVCGLVASTAAFIMGEAKTQIKIPFTSLNVPAVLAIGTVVGASSLVSDITHDYVLPHINSSAKLSNIESALLQIALSGCATSALLILGSGLPADNFLNIFLLGSVSVVAGDYLNEKFIKGSHGLF